MKCLHQGPFRAVVLLCAAVMLLVPALGAAGAEAGTEGSAAAESFSWFRFLAPFHMVLLHLPIGFFTVAALLELWNWRKPSMERREVTQLILCVGLVATVVTMGLGYLRASDGGYDELLLRRHRGWGIAAAALMAIAWFLHRNLIQQPAPGGIVGFRVLLFTGFLCLAVAGHHGGSLTHGTTFLTENAPEPVRAFLGEGPAASQAPAIAGPDAFGPVRAVLARKCQSCHGPEKQKGGLRLDERAAALKGGESGKPAIVPGDPGRSEVVRAILLPKDHDEVMPPEGKEPLTEGELALVIQWIRSGAPE